MKLILLIGILTLLVTLSLLIVVALWRHKRATVADIQLIGEIGEVSRRLDPEGAVLVHGGLWPARSRHGAVIAAKMRVRVVAIQGHLVVVEICD